MDKVIIGFLFKKVQELISKTIELYVHHKQQLINQISCSLNWFTSNIQKPYSILVGPASLAILAILSPERLKIDLGLMLWICLALSFAIMLLFRWAEKDLKPVN